MDLKAEWRQLQKLPDSPEKDAAIQKWRLRLPVPYRIANLLSTGADRTGPGQEAMAFLRDQMREADAFTGDLDVELREAHAIARQRLGLTELEWQSITTAEIESHLRHHLGKSSKAGSKVERGAGLSGNPLANLPPPLMRAPPEQSAPAAPPDQSAPAAPPDQSAPAAVTEQEERAARRRAVVDPIFEEKGWTCYEWEKQAKVTQHVGNRYLAGKTKCLSVGSHHKLAGALGLKKLPS